MADYTARCRGRIVGDVLYVRTPGDVIRVYLRLELIRDVARTAGLTIQDCVLAGEWGPESPSLATPVKAKRLGWEPEFAMMDIDGVLAPVARGGGSPFPETPPGFVCGEHGIILAIIRQQ